MTDEKNGPLVTTSTMLIYELYYTFVAHTL
jgi:hypothetical protein